jgi:group I intron endonuclease
MDFLYVFENILSHKAEIFATLGGFGGIYMFVNKINGNSYVGSTNNFCRRFSEHIYGSRGNTALQRAFAQYDKHSFIILAIVPSVKWILLFLEQLALDYIKPAYNFLKTADLI